MSDSITKIQYISVADTKIFKVTDIDFKNLAIEATQTDLSVEDVSENEVFPVEEFGEFSVRLINSDGMGEIDKDSAFDCEVRSKALGCD